MTPTTKPSVLAIIPARGGSKGIPGKNLRVLAGRSLIGHSVHAALNAKLVHRVVVSTDSPAIAEAARASGAEYVLRPDELSGDRSPSEAALLHVLDELKKKEGYEPSHVVFLQCTSPLTLPEDIDGTVIALLDSGADTALTVAPYHSFLWKMDGERAVGINHDSSKRPMRQEREGQYLETGSVYVMKTEGLLKNKFRFFGKTVFHVIPRERAFEIDDPVDLTIAAELLREQTAASAKIPVPPSALILDFDGVFTDNRVLVLQDGTEAVLCSRGDGFGLGQLREARIPVFCLSKEINPVVKARCEKLKIPFIQGQDDKLPVLRAWAEREKIDLSRSIYVGNDVNDLECMAAVGYSIVPSDAHPEALRAASHVLAAPGGQGAIREVTDLILEKIKLKGEKKNA